MQSRCDPAESHDPRHVLYLPRWHMELAILSMPFTPPCSAPPLSPLCQKSPTSSVLQVHFHLVILEQEKTKKGATNDEKRRGVSPSMKKQTKQQAILHQLRSLANQPRAGTLCPGGT